MPQRARRPCSHPGCPALVTDRFCPTHRRQVEQRRGSSTARGYDSAWERLRRQILLTEPLCRHCAEAGRVVAATDVDHIKAKRDGGTDAVFNLQPLCHACHSRKTLAELRS